MKYTAENITDEEIRQVRGWDWICATCTNWALYCICDAPVVCRCESHMCAPMVARCAEILNARATESKR